jgi:hypothetical protein
MQAVVVVRGACVRPTAVAVRAMSNAPKKKAKDKDAGSKADKGGAGDKAKVSKSARQAQQLAIEDAKKSKAKQGASMRRSAALLSVCWLTRGGCSPSQCNHAKVPRRVQCYPAPIRRSICCGRFGHVRLVSRVRASACGLGTSKLCTALMRRIQMRELAISVLKKTAHPHTASQHDATKLLHCAESSGDVDVALLVMERMRQRETVFGESVCHECVRLSNAPSYPRNGC